MANILAPEDLGRIHTAADVLWGKDEHMPEAEIAKVRGEVIAIICGSWRHGEVSHFSKLRAIMEVGGGFPSPKDLDYANCFSRGIRVLSCAPAFGPAVAETPGDKPWVRVTEDDRTIKIETTNSKPLFPRRTPSSG